jgi:hypothetical protein
MEWWDIVAANLSGFELDLHAHLFYDAGNGMEVLRSAWPSNLPSPPSDATVASWLSQVTK